VRARSGTLPSSPASRSPPEPRAPPDDVATDGCVHVEADWFGGNATPNFPRRADHLSVTAQGGPDRCATPRDCADTSPPRRQRP
jgi:hypothetical protein